MDVDLEVCGRFVDGGCCDCVMEKGVEGVNAELVVAKMAIAMADVSVNFIFYSNLCWEKMNAAVLFRYDICSLTVVKFANKRIRRTILCYKVQAVL